MRFRFTIEELKNMSDTEVLLKLVRERMTTLHPYSPLSLRLQHIEQNLNEKRRS